MQLKDFLDAMTPEIYENLKESLELGRWPDGERLTNEQRDRGLQALIAWEYEHLPASERVGYMPQKCKSTQKKEPVEETILRFKNT